MLNAEWRIHATRSLKWKRNWKMTLKWNHAAKQHLCMVLVWSKAKRSEALFFWLQAFAFAIVTTDFLFLTFFLIFNFLISFSFFFHWSNDQLIYLFITYYFFFFFWIWITLECEDLWTTTLSLFHHQMKDNTYKGLGVNLIFIVYALNSWA